MAELQNNRLLAACRLCMPCNQKSVRRCSTCDMVADPKQCSRSMRSNILSNGSGRLVSSTLLVISMLIGGTCVFLWSFKPRTWSADSLREHVHQRWAHMLLHTKYRESGQEQDLQESAPCPAGV